MATSSHVARCFRSLAGTVEQLGRQRPNNRSDELCEDDELSALLFTYFVAVADAVKMSEERQLRVVERARQMARNAVGYEIEVVPMIKEG